MKKIAYISLVVLAIMLIGSCQKHPVPVVYSGSSGGGSSSADLPTVTTSTVSDITMTTAKCGGTITSDGGASVKVRGICWNTTGSPTTADSHTTDSVAATSFTHTMTGLTANTTYYVRAYATNSAGTAYGAQKSFKTTQSLATVIITSVSNITSNSVTIACKVTSQGDASVTERGVCWDYFHTPTTSDAHLSSGSGSGSYTITITGLSSNTTYNIRAYAINANGTAYSEVTNVVTQYGGGGSNAPTGAINGLFSVSETQQVYFSQGNLQYQASTNTWRFAENQYDYIGSDNSNISSSYSGWIDLFGWGTGNNPTNSSTDNNDYATFNDWGNNAISNGGNTTNTWRTLTKDEWVYVFNTRSTSSGIRYAKAQVNGINGVILLPDNWSSSNYSLSSTNTGGASFSSNTISQSDWTNRLEANGAVFLPAAGNRNGTSVYNVGSFGGYWSATYAASTLAYSVGFQDSYLYSIDNDCKAGRSVRLIQDAN